jgi:Rrf2 family protein
VPNIPVPTHGKTWVDGVSSWPSELANMPLVFVKHNTFEGDCRHISRGTMRINIVRLGLMITKTSLLATRALLCLAWDKNDAAISPRNIALQLGESQTYMAKVLRSLVKAGILRAEHGSKGGVLLNRRPDEITLLAVVEACQGAIVGNYCEDVDDIGTTCAFHRAAVELREAIIAVLSRWNLEALAKSPDATRCGPRGKRCLMAEFPLSAAGPMLRRKASRKNAMS